MSSDSIMHSPPEKLNFGHFQGMISISIGKNLSSSNLLLLQFGQNKYISNFRDFLKVYLSLEHCSPIWLSSFANTTHSNIVVSMENASNINMYCSRNINYFYLICFSLLYYENLAFLKFIFAILLSLDIKTPSNSISTKKESFLLPFFFEDMKLIH